MYNIILYVVAILILFVFLKLIGIKTKTALKFVLNSILGGLIFFLLIKFGSTFGIEAKANGITSIVTGILGIPGTIIVTVLEVIGIIV